MSFFHTLKRRRKVQLIVLAISLQMQGARCLSLGRPMKVKQITTLASIEATKFLLTEGFDFVLTERFCQDPVEEYFGNQRKLGRRSDNPGT